MTMILLVCSTGIGLTRYITLKGVEGGGINKIHYVKERNCVIWNLSHTSKKDIRRKNTKQTTHTKNYMHNLQ